MTEEDLNNLKNCSIELEKFKLEVLEPLKNTLSGEIRRYITIHRKIETTIIESNKILDHIKSCLK